MGSAGGSKSQPYMLQGGLTSKPSEVPTGSTHHAGVEGKDGKIWCQKQPTQGYQTLLSALDGKLTYRLSHTSFFG